MQIMRMHTNYANGDVKIIHSKLSYMVTGLCFKVQSDLGRFCRERQYGDALEKYLKVSNVEYKREAVLDNKLIHGNRADFIIDNKILLELKVIPFITKEDYFQVQRYLKNTELKLGLIVNFRSKYLKPKRIINNLI